MKTFAILALAVFTVPVLGAQVAQGVLEEVKAAFEKKLPEGWTVRVDREKQRIEIEKEGKILQNPIPIPSAMRGTQAAPKLERFRVQLEAGEFVSLLEYKRRSDDNRRIHQELGVMYRSMRGISHKSDSFIPSSDEEREQVRAYEELKAKVHELPGFFYQEAASFVLDNWSQLGGGIEGATLLIADEVVREQVRKDLGEAFSVLGRYEREEEGGG